jgi:hypothetical protein
MIEVFGTLDQRVSAVNGNKKSSINHLTRITSDTGSVRLIIGAGDTTPAGWSINEITEGIPLLIH